MAWTQFDIGLILTIGTITGLALQIPAGALVDGVPTKQPLAALAVASISASALLLALWPTFNAVVVAKILHAIASSLLGPTLVAMSLGLVGHALFSIRLGRNVRFLSLGNAIAAGLAGGIAYYSSNQAIFFLTAALGVPTLIALAQISSSEIDLELARGGMSKSEGGTWFDTISGLMHNRVLLGFAAAVMLFQLANAAMLPILCGDVGKAGSGNGRFGAINMYPHAAIRCCSHRTVDRGEGAKLGPSPAFIAYFCRPFAPRRNIRRDERPLLARCGADSLTAFPLRHLASWFRLSSRM